jgi:SpoVK/Ycf46/Vps4 family AAA+-type ATPase
VTLTWDAMVRALAEVTPSSLLEFSTTLYPDLNASLSWDHFVGYAEAKQHAQRIAKMIRYKSHPGEGGKSLVGAKRSKGMVVYGASGCGKSHLVRVMAKEVSEPHVDGSSSKRAPSDERRGNVFQYTVCRCT